MGIGTFTTLLLGYKTAERLYELERIEGREEAVERLDDVLFHKIPYYFGLHLTKENNPLCQSLLLCLLFPKG